MSDTSYAALLEFTHELADAAAKVTLPLFRHLQGVDNKLEVGFDPVTKADRDGELAIRALIEKNFPQHAILGEEFGTKAGDDHQWVLDPIDGTRAFISGIPSWGTLIALNVGGHPKLGLMDQPFTGERYFAGQGDGAYLRHNGTQTRLQTRPCAGLSEAVISTTDPSLFDAAGQQKWQMLSQKSRLARCGGDCYGYAMVAAGHIDAVIENGLQAYDIQALIPLVQEAGGMVTNWQGGDAASGGSVLACGDKNVHAEILALLA
jgi:histidinol phosphatase-like enzyme (inositol monophosphatase family)